MIYLRPLEIRELLKLQFLLSEKTGFGYEEMQKMPMHILMGLWNAKRGVLEDRSKEQEKQQGASSGAGQNAPNMGSMMGMAKSMMPSAPSLPSMGSFKLK